MRTAGVLSLLFCFALVLPSPVGAVTSADIVALTAENDGDRVVFEGEAIGDILDGGKDHSWVNVLSGGTALGVWMPTEAVPVETLGKYGVRGDTLRVTGVLNVSCAKHGGDFDVHADSIELVRRGGSVEDPVGWWKLGVAAVAGVAALGQSLLYRRRRLRQDLA